MKRIISIILGGLMMLGLLTGCVGEVKDAMTPTQFQRTMEEKGFMIVDQTDSASDDDYQKILVALEEDKFSFEYYFMNRGIAAKDVYDYATQNLDALYKDDNSAVIVATSSEEKETGDYAVSASDYYVRVLWKKNSVLYVTAYVDYIDEAKSIIEELGY